jgi:hypothetical protein
MYIDIYHFAIVDQTHLGSQIPCTDTIRLAIMPTLHTPDTSRIDHQDHRRIHDEERVCAFFSLPSKQEGNPSMRATNERDDDRRPPGEPRDSKDNKTNSLCIYVAAAARG